MGWTDDRFLKFVRLFCAVRAVTMSGLNLAMVARRSYWRKDEESLEMTITVLLMTILTGQNHTVVAEYDTPKACEVAAQAHQKVLLDYNITLVYSCSPKAGSR